jgi:hypothetical protein
MSAAMNMDLGAGLGQLFKRESPDHFPADDSWKEGMDHYANLGNYEIWIGKDEPFMRVAQRKTFTRVKSDVIETCQRVVTIGTRSELAWDYAYHLDTFPPSMEENLKMAIKGGCRSSWVAFVLAKHLPTLTIN